MPFPPSHHPSLACPSQLGPLLYPFLSAFPLLFSHSLSVSLPLLIRAFDCLGWSYPSAITPWSSPPLLSVRLLHPQSATPTSSSAKPLGSSSLSKESQFGVLSSPRFGPITLYLTAKSTHLAAVCTKDDPAALGVGLFRARADRRAARGPKRIRLGDFPPLLLQLI